MHKHFYEQEVKKHTVWFITSEYIVTCGPYRDFYEMTYVEASFHMKKGQIYWENKEYEQRNSNFRD